MTKVFLNQNSMEATKIPGNKISYLVSGAIALLAIATLSLYTNQTTHAAPPPFQATCTANPTSTVPGQEVVFTVNVSGGTAPYEYSWPEQLADAQISFQGNIASVTFATAGTKTFNAQVADSSNPVGYGDVPCSVVVENTESNLTATCVAAPSPATVGQEVVYTITPTGGTGPYTYGWSSDFDSQGNIGTRTYTTAGQKGSNITVTDSNQETFTVLCSDTVNQESSGGKCAGFTDVPTNDSECDAITYMKSIGAMTGNPDGTFAPQAVLQRDQVAKIVLETFNKYTDGTDYCNGNNPFPDVTSSAWSYQYICQGKTLGMITGYLSGADAGYYRPSRSVNRAEFLALVLRNVSDTMPSVNSTSYDDVKAGEWFSGYAKYALNLSLFIAPNLHPTSVVARWEVADVIYKLHQAGKV